jgi:hypothetical protein
MKFKKNKKTCDCSDLCESFCDDINIIGEHDSCKKLDETVLKNPILGRTDLRMQFFKYCDIWWPTLKLDESCFYQNTPKGHIVNLQKKKSFSM